MDDLRRIRYVTEHYSQLQGLQPRVRAVALNVLIGGGLAVAAVGDDRVLRRAMALRSAS